MESDFLASGNTFFIYFSDISASDLCRYHKFIQVFFSSSENIVLKQILLASETDFPASGNHLVPISQISLSLEAVFPPLGNIF